MVEALVIIAALGGLELTLWCIGRREQKKQIELLDAIWTELAIRNSVDEEARSAAAHWDRVGSVDASRPLPEAH